ncbi:MAG: hypothetical protein ABJ387_03485 [Balneola sp.]
MEFVSFKAIKSLYGVALIAFAQAQSVDVISNAFDKAFSLGLLVIGIIIVWKSNQKATEYNQLRDQKFEEVLERTTKALENNNSLMERVLKQIEKN